jgi:hypothetical protein
MTSESKILTVSYGTFSCTLEGFDDPFNAMKAIAEYFRDLAAEDRYFGAEPPQPDAAMLHRIAEREVSRLVETRVRDSGVIVSPQTDAAPEGERPAARITGRPRTTPRTSHNEVVPASTAPAAVEPSLQDVIPTGVVAKLARIRQSVNPPPIGAPMADEVMRSLSEDGDDFGAALITEDESEATAEDAGSDVLNRLGALIHAPEAGAEVADAADAPADVAAPASSVDSWLVETDDAMLLSDVPETLPAADLPDTGIAVAEPVAADLSGDGDIATSLAEAEAAPVAAAAADVAIDDFLPEASVEAPATLDAALREDPVAEDLSAAEAPIDDAMPLILSETPPEAEVEDAVEAVVAAPVEDQVPAPVEAAAEIPVPAAEVVEPEPAPVLGKATGKAKRVSSRVVRIHPDDDGAATADPNATRILSPNGEDAEVARLLRQADDVMADEDNRRRLDSIAHLRAAVAATEADRAVSGEPEKPSAEDRLDPYRDVLAQVVQPDPEPDEAAKPTVKPRRKTVSVRPQEPRPGTIRPGMVSPPPLVLVSEQRIDRIDAPPPAPAPAPAPAPQPAEGQPMVALRTGRLTGAIGIGAAAVSPALQPQKIVLEQPSRGAAADLDEEDDIDEDLTEAHEAGLASFAERVGVKSMADMLEAAAAYATCIEQRGQFTRPQLMRRLMATAGGRPVSREDGLRSFGTLLRTGRIEKVSRGFYVLAEHSPYLAEARRMA